MDTESWITIVPHIVMGMVTIVVTFLAFWFNKRLKEMEIRDRQSGRDFEVTKVVTAKAMEVMAESYHITHRINYALNVYHSATPEAKESISEDLKKANTYWEKNLFYLPEVIRERITPFTNMTYASMTDGRTGEHAFDKALDEIHDMFIKIKAAFSPFMKKYNLLDQQGAGTDSDD